MAYEYKGLGYESEDISDVSATVEGTTLTITITLKDGSTKVATSTLPSGGGGVELITAKTTSGTLTAEQLAAMNENPQNFVFKVNSSAFQFIGTSNVAENGATTPYIIYTRVLPAGRDNNLSYVQRSDVRVNANTGEWTLETVNYFVSSSGGGVELITLTDTSGTLTSEQLTKINDTPESVVFLQNGNAYHFASISTSASSAIYSYTMKVGNSIYYYTITVNLSTGAYTRSVVTLTVPELPTPTTSDTGKVLGVINGAYALVDGASIDTAANSAGGTTYTISTGGGA